MNPFKIGDHVYQVGMPESVQVVRIMTSHSVEVQSMDGHDRGSAHINYLSFKPWPKPCHERPVQDGWWVVTYRDDDTPFVRKVKSGCIIYVGTQHPIERYTLHKYIGTDWKQG